ncbi:hypothetical protein FPV67DRAFT_1778848 [Lyophyllum atratum]|nr:hypothetical protein FPV67DRAFT_1778848 [Lyophyllum atratum]
MHATSAVALAVVALNAASTLAIPMGPIGEGMEARSIFGRAPTKAAAADPKAVTDPKASPAAHAGSHEKAAANGSATTITVTLHPRPTACKAGETPSVKHKSKGNKHGTHEKTGAEGSEHAGSKKAAPAQAVAARSAGASPTPSGSKDAAAGAAHTPAPHHGNHKDTSHKAGAVFSTNTHVGKDHKTTVREFVKATSTHCFAPTGSPNAKGGAHKSEKATDAAHKSEKATDAAHKGEKATEKTPAKVVRRSAGATTPTPTDKTHPGKAHEKAAANGSATTVTVTVTPRPTACKAGETPSVKHKSKGNKHGTHEKTGVEGSEHTGSKKAAPAQAVVARSAGASPTHSSKDAASHAAPTPAAHHGNHKDSSNHKAGAVFSTNTHVGKDSKTTVREFVKATSTHCFAPTASPNAKGGAHKSEKATDSTTHKNGSPAPVKGKTDTKLVARAVDLLERYFSELDELD